MAAAFVELTRVGTETHGTSVLVNLGTVAWIEAGSDGTSRIVFAVAAPGERDEIQPLTMVVHESPQDIAALTGVVQKTDREAIAQAWVDQRGRRGLGDDGE